MAIITGSRDDDTLGAFSRKIEGFEGHDILYGLDGSDTISGGEGNDLLKGGNGNDYLFGGFSWVYHLNGSDKLVGGSGNDFLVGGGGEDTLLGGAGNDALYSFSGKSLLRGGAGDDVLSYGGTLKGGKGNDTLASPNGRADLLSGGAGDDRLYWHDAVRIDGGSGTDMLTVLFTSGLPDVSWDEVLDLTAIAPGRFTNIERIDLRSFHQSNTLVLGEHELLALSSTTDTLRVVGDGVDAVDIVGTFVDQGIHGGYHHYHVGAGRLLVDTDIKDVF